MPHEELAEVGIPVGAEAFEAGCSVVKRMGEQSDPGLAVTHHPSVQVHPGVRRSRHSRRFDQPGRFGGSRTLALVHAPAGTASRAACLTLICTVSPSMLPVVASSSPAR